MRVTNEFVAACARLKLCRTLAHFPPSLLAGLSAKGCQWCVLVDQADNDPSFRRQSKLDTTKSMRDLQVRLPAVVGNSLFNCL